MNKAFPEAMAPVPESMSRAFECIPDNNDRPILAAAILGHANVIVTQNIRHFPKECLATYNLYCQTADDFLIRQYDRDRPLVLDKLDDQAAAISKDRSYVVASLKRSAPRFAELFEEHA